RGKAAPNVISVVCADAESAMASSPAPARATPRRAMVMRIVSPRTRVPSLRGKPQGGLRQLRRPRHHALAVLHLGEERPGIDVDPALVVLVLAADAAEL